MRGLVVGPLPLPAAGRRVIVPEGHSGVMGVAQVKTKKVVERRDSEGLWMWWLVLVLVLLGLGEQRRLRVLRSPSPLHHFVAAALAPRS